jgi:hypothetical protein
MPVSTQQGDDTPPSKHTSQRSISHCVLDIMDIMESEEYTQSLSSNSYWPHRGEFYVMYTSQRSRDSAVGIATGYGLDDRRGRSYSPGRERPDLFCGPPRLFSDGYRGLFPLG